MRERLLVAFGTLILVIIALYGIPRAYSLAENVQATQTDELTHSVDLIEELIAERGRTGEVDAQYLDGLSRESERIEYRDAEGELIAEAGDALAGHAQDVTVARELAGGEQLTVARAGEFVQEQIVAAVLPVVLLGLVLIVSAGIACLVIARRLSRPFQELAETASRLGGGSFDIPEPDYRVPEVQAIGTALYDSARRLKELLDREHEFAANASHQLRTPITALRLELEDLTYWPETSPEVAAELTRALGELDRLSAAVTELLELARGQRLGSASTVQLSELLNDSARRWTRHAQAQGRHLEVLAPAELTGVLHEGPVAQIVDVLIENALDHGSGDIGLRAEDAGSHLRLSVADQGPRPEQGDLFERRVTQGGGEGIGLAVAAELAIAAGGTLRLESGATTCFVLIVPQSRDLIPARAGISSGAE